LEKGRQVLLAYEVERTRIHRAGRECVVRNLGRAWVEEAGERGEKSSDPQKGKKRNSRGRKGYSHKRKKDFRTRSKVDRETMHYYKRGSTTKKKVVSQHRKESPQAQGEGGKIITT